MPNSYSTDPAMIQRTLEALYEPGDVVELRVLEALTGSYRRPHIESGYFNDWGMLATAAATIDQAKGWYVTLNRVNPALLARGDNRIQLAGRGTTTSDSDVTQRRWLPIDLDPQRPTGISATDAEHAAAMERAQQVQVFLRTRGWPDPIVADSGNGAHLLYRIDLPAADGGLVQRCLGRLAEQFSDEAVTLDTTVHNPARIWKLYGTLACKGDSTTERPHRMAQLSAVPATIEPVPQRLLEALAAPATAAARRGSGSGNGHFDLQDWITRYELDVTGPTPWEGGQRWVFTVCPFDPSHTDHSAYLVQHANGAIAAGCHHNGCDGKGWHDLRDLVESGRRQPGGDANTPRITCRTMSRTDAAAVSVCLGSEVLTAERVELLRPEAVQEFLDRLCTTHDSLDRGNIETYLRRWAAENLVERSTPPQDAVGEADDEPDVAALLEGTPEEVIAEARTMLASPDLFDQVLNDIAILGVTGERDLAGTVYLVGTSRLLDEPLAAIVQGPSTSGKSYIVNKVGECFPPEAVLVATQLTPNALFYMPPGHLAHRFVVAGERSRREDDDTADATRALREMLSAGKLSKAVPIKVDGKLETVVIEQAGPIAYVETTTLTDIFGEDANRCILLTTDERPAQTRDILRAKAIADARGAMADPRPILAKHHAIQRMLRPYFVCVPYAERLAGALPDDPIEVRRTYGHVTSMIRASALLHQNQRNVDAEGRLLANEDDYRIARQLLGPSIGRQLGRGISEPARRSSDRLRTWAEHRIFSVGEVRVRGHESASKSAIHGWLHELHEAGLVEMVDAQRGSTPARWRLAAIDRCLDMQTPLPPVETICV